MSMKNKMIAIMQPTYIPWLGYFSMIDKVEQFVFLDSVQIVGRSWQVRNKIKLLEEEKILTIPMCKQQQRNERRINTTKYNGNEWKASHLGTIRMAYHESEFFEQVFPLLEKLYIQEYASIGEFNSTIIMNIAHEIGIDTEFLFSSKMTVSGKKDRLLTDICKKLQANQYLSAQGSATYIEKENPGGEFSKNGIQLYYQNYKHPQYRQRGERFIPFIGIYDLLFNEGFDQALEIIRSGNRDDINYKKYREEYM